MALERQSIEKKDFPVGRRGYDPAAVDSHLRQIANEVEELKHSTSGRTETLASAASERVRAIVEAAEASAAEIQQRAEENARDIRAEATSDAKREREHAASAAQRERNQAAAEAHSQREQAVQQAREYVGQVSGSTSQMLKRLEAMESELGALTDSLRTGSSRLTADLGQLESEMDDLGAVTYAPRQPGVAPERAGPQSAGVAAVGQAEVAPTSEAQTEAVPAETVPERALEPEPGDAATGGEPAMDALEESLAARGDDDDTEGARLIALNMALNGTPREETDRYLAENFQLSNRGQLLDEVYASVEG